MYLFPDTNVFMHYRLFTELDWCAIGEAPEVVVMLTTTVLTQLDYRKEHDSRSVMRERVQTVLRKLRRLIAGDPEAAMRSGASLQFYHKNATEACRRYNLDPERTDQYIVATALAFRDDNPEADVAIATGDYGMMILCEHYGLAVREMPAALHLKTDDEEAKKVRQLQEELAKERSRRPVLSVAFQSGADHLRVKLRPPVETSPAAVAAFVRRQLEKYRPLPTAEAPPRGPGDISAAAARLAALGSSLGVPLKERESYNKELAAYKEAYQAWAAEALNYDAMEARTFPVNFCLLNTGTAPASKTVVELDFPPNVSISRELPKPPRAPKPPTQPRSHLLGYTGFERDFATFLPHRNVLHELSEIAAASRPRSVSAPKMTNGDRPRVTINVGEVLHNVPVQLVQDLLVTFRDAAAVGSFPVAYTVHAAALREPESGSIHIVIEPTAEDSGDERT